MKYFFSNSAQSRGVRNKIARQSQLLGITEADIIEIDLLKLVRLGITGFFSKFHGTYYVREGMLINILFLTYKVEDLVVELNRPLTSVVGKRSRFFLYLRRLLMRNLLRKADRIICMSEEIFLSLELPLRKNAEVFENFFGYVTLTHQEFAEASKEYDLLIVADLTQPWQAADFLKQYLIKYENRTLLHIGGGRIDLPNVTSLGYLTDQDDLLRQVAKARVALSQLGLKRIGFSQATPLKHVDYVVARLPIISGARDLLLETVYDIAYLSFEDIHELERLVLEASAGYCPVDANNLIDKITDYSKRYVNFVCR